jgi:hypothetical protein
MGWISDSIFFVISGFIVVLIAHFFLGIPLDGTARPVFFLGFIGSLIIVYGFKKSEVFVLTVLGILLVTGVIFFIAMPFLSGPGTTAKELPTNTNAVNAYNSNLVTQTSPTQVEYIYRSYKWSFGGSTHRYSIGIPQGLYEFYREQPHDNKDYAKYAITDSDRKVLTKITSTFQEKSDSKTVAAHNIVAFVQSLPYVTDKVSTGYDDYARYPIETLVNNGGDCEDTAILTAALLKEMNYDVILLRFPKHVAVGITCPECSGRYYTYKNKDYFYLETTENNWEVGQIPAELKNEKNVKALPI